jgi:hypothetical protein
MGIGASIFLIALGAILAFALNVHIGGVDIHVIGWILMAVGAIGLFVTLYVWGGRRRRTVVYRDGGGYPGPGYGRVVERTEVDRDVPL